MMQLTRQVSSIARSIKGKESTDGATPRRVNHQTETTKAGR